MLLHHRGALEVIQQSFLALESGIGNFANLLRVEFLPFLVIKQTKQLGNSFFIMEGPKVHEGITHIAFVFVINRQVKEIILVLEV